MKIGIYIGVILLVLAGIFIFQNSAVVEVRFLFWKFTSSLAALIFLLFAAGATAGWLLNSALRFRSRGKDVSSK